MYFKKANGFVFFYFRNVVVLTIIFIIKYKKKKKTGICIREILDEEVYLRYFDCVVKC